MTVPTMPGMPLVQDTRLVSSLLLGSFELLTYATAADYADLLGSPKARGEDTLVPNVSGLDPNPRRPTGTEQKMVIACVGYCSRTSATLVSNPFTQWVTNWYLLRGACDPISTGDGTVMATMTLAGGVTKTGKLTPLGIRVTSMAGPTCLAEFSYSLPFGALA